MLYSKWFKIYSWQPCDRIVSIFLALPENLRAIRIVFRQTENIFDSLEDFQTSNFQDCLKTVETIRKVSGLSGYFPSVLKSVRSVWKPAKLSGIFEPLFGFWTHFGTFNQKSGLSGNFTACLLSFHVVCKLFRCQETVQPALKPTISRSSGERL